MISREKMLSLYAAMVKYRRIAVEAGRITGTPSDTTGWEATLAGVTADLVNGDQLSAAPASAVHTVIAAMGREQAGGPVLPAHGVGSSRDAHAGDGGFDTAYRAAREFKSGSQGRVAVHLCSGPVENWEWRGRLADVARRSLPLLIISQRAAAERDARPRNSASAPRQHKPPARISGVPLITVDGNDVFAVYRVASESIFRARHGRGPTLISCIAALSHAGAVGQLREREAAGGPDPILSMESYLTRKRILTKAVKGRMDSLLCGEIAPARDLGIQ